MEELVFHDDLNDPSGRVFFCKHPPNIGPGGCGTAATDFGGESNRRWFLWTDSTQQVSWQQDVVQGGLLLVIHD